MTGEPKSKLLRLDSFLHSFHGFASVNCATLARNHVYVMLSCFFGLAVVNAGCLRLRVLHCLQGVQLFKAITFARLE